MLVEIAEDPDAKDNARVAAARTVIERGHGAAERKSITDVNVSVFDARQAHFDALKKLVNSTPVPFKVIEGEALRPKRSSYEE